MGKKLIKDMSLLHSETYDRQLGLRVRVKLVDLNGTGKHSNETLPKARLSAAVGIIGECTSAGRITEIAPTEDKRQQSVEICIASGRKIREADFETHIEICKVCSNRVDLQLDFMETLELAVYQRKGQPQTAKVHGALLVSAPALNFAVCGEIEPV